MVIEPDTGNEWKDIIVEQANCNIQEGCSTRWWSRGDGAAKGTARMKLDGGNRLIALYRDDIGYVTTFMIVRR